jgi:hypothetical protein
MEENEHPNFFRTHKALAFLPLLLMGAGVWYYVAGRVAPGSEETSQPAPAKAEAAVPAPASTPWLSGVAAARLPGAYDPKQGLDIQGSPEFQSQVTHALKLIWLADRDTFLFVKNNLPVIRNYDKTGFYLENGRPVASLSSGHAFRSLTWCAGIMAHQAWHAWYIANTKRKTRAAPPLPGVKDERMPDANPARMDYKGMDAILYTEGKAFDFQLEVLRKIGAPRKETDLVLRRAPRDFSAGHDGSYTLNP